MNYLKEQINQMMVGDTTYNLDDYNNLIKQCADKYEMGAVVYIYDHMKSKNVEPNGQTYNYISKLHSKTVNEHNRLDIKMFNSLKPRRRIHKIMKGYEYSDKYQTALEHLDKVKSFLNKNPEYKVYDKIRLIQILSKNCEIDKNTARYIVTNLKKTKFLVKRKVDDFSGIEKYLKVNERGGESQKKISDYFGKSDSHASTNTSLYKS